MLISNTNGHHKDKLIDIFKSCRDRIIIVSPYLSENVSSLLCFFDFENVNQVELVTTFKPSDQDQLTKPFQLFEFFEFFKKKHPNVKVKIHVDNKLHAKIYFAIDPHIKKMILTSGNFTENGLVHNHEWGLLIEQEEYVDGALEELFEYIDYPEISFHQIERACLFADQYLKENPTWNSKPSISSDILTAVYSDNNIENANPQYFLKPIGHKEHPIQLENREDFSQLHQNLHFSKKYPKGVKKGDFIITTAVGAGCLLSYFRVTAGVQRVSDEEVKNHIWAERWPWYVEGKNNSPNFGSKWWTYNIRRQDMLDKFIESHPNTPVTYAGGYSLGTINMGNDKVKLTKEFGEFLILEIKKYEELIISEREC